jgi:methionine sulfoxide reductase catalytic subunit
VLCWFLVFILIHTTLVFTTGLLRNLNVGYAARNSDSWVGFGVFAASMVVVVVAWVAATPFTLRRPRLVQRLGFTIVGPLQRLFEHVDTEPGQYSEQDISRYFWMNGAFPQRIHGLVENPVELSLAELRQLPYHEQITQHFCIQGWSGVASGAACRCRRSLSSCGPAPKPAGFS